EHRGGNRRRAGTSDALDALVDDAIRGIGIGDHESDGEGNIGAGDDALAGVARERDRLAGAGDADWPVAGGEGVDGGGGEDLGADLGFEIAGEYALAPGTFLLPGRVVARGLPDVREVEDRQGKACHPTRVVQLIGPYPRRAQVADVDHRRRPRFTARGGEGR